MTVLSWTRRGIPDDDPCAGDGTDRDPCVVISGTVLVMDSKVQNVYPGQPVRSPAWDRR